VPTLINGLNNVVEISAGGEHTLIKKNDQSILAFGYNLYRQLGQGNIMNTNSNVPVVCNLQCPNSVGINYFFSESIFSIYPNPTTKSISIKATDKLIGKKYNIKDANGKLLLSGDIHSEETLISMEEFTAGVYFISIEEIHLKIIRIE
jgi:hypothetical protein